MTSYRASLAVRSSFVQSTTWSAPIDRTSSTFRVLHTPVTSAPSCFESRA
jgi:hypothetical protein